MAQHKCEGDRPLRNPQKGNIQMDRFNAWVGALVARIENEKGQTFVEYALVLAVIVVGVLLATTWTGLTGAIDGAITDVVNSF
jgi:Flp pilus assembly pilin Flp